jgi:hypothetical protein
MYGVAYDGKGKSPAFGGVGLIPLRDARAYWNARLEMPPLLTMQIMGAKHVLSTILVSVSPFHYRVVVGMQRRASGPLILFIAALYPNRRRHQTHSRIDT